MNHIQRFNLLSSILETAPYVHEWDEFFLPTGDLLINFIVDFPTTTKTATKNTTTPTKKPFAELHRQGGVHHFTLMLQKDSPDLKDSTLYREHAVSLQEDYTFPATTTEKITTSFEDMLANLFYILLEDRT